MFKYGKQRELAEYYKDFPYGKELNKAIWDFFEDKDRHLWLSDIENIASKLNIPIIWAITHVGIQNFYICGLITKIITK
jgi:hypothetical protein